MSSKVSCIAYGPVKAESATASMPTKLERFGALLGSEKILGRFKQVVEKGDLAEANVAMSQLWKTANSRWSTGKAKSSASLKMAELCREKAPKALYFVACGYTGAGAREMLLAVDALRSIAKSNEDAFVRVYNSHG